MAESDRFRRYANLEAYLFGEVGPHFRQTGRLPAVDLFTIFIWKANRKKYEMRARVTALVNGDFEKGARSLVGAIRDAKNQKECLRAVMATGIRLPTATAILTVLYPEEFTVYDIRVCQSLGRFHKLGYKPFSDELWSAYQNFITSVRNEAPCGLTLRECDHHHWGKSFDEDRRRAARDGRPVEKSRGQGARTSLP